MVMRKIGSKQTLLGWNKIVELKLQRFGVLGEVGVGWGGVGVGLG